MVGGTEPKSLMASLLEAFILSFQLFLSALNNACRIPHPLVDSFEQSSQPQRFLTQGSNIGCKQNSKIAIFGNSQSDFSLFLWNVAM